MWKPCVVVWLFVLSVALFPRSRCSGLLAADARSLDRAAVIGNIKIPLLVPVSVLLEPNESKRVVITNISHQASSVVTQVYSHMQNVTVSLSRFFSVDSSYTSSSAGVVLILQPAAEKAKFYIKAGAEEVSVTLFALPYTSQDPVPGACNLEFVLENDPNLHLMFNVYETTVSFAPANLGTSRGLLPPVCDVGTDAHTRWRLTYDLYQYFLPENDLTVASLLTGMRKMSSVQSIENNGMKITTISSSQQTRLYGNSYVGIGVIYNVIVRDPLLKTSAAYVPVSTYTCNLSAKGSKCKDSDETFIYIQVLCTVLGIYGLLLCLVGHRIFEAEFLFFGFLIFAFISFVVVTRFSSLDFIRRFAILVGTGLFGGLTMTLMRWRFGRPVICVACAGLVLGFLVAAIIFFTPLANFSLFHNDLNFWMVYAFITLVIPTVLLPFVKTLNIITCALVGSYAVIVAVGVYIYSSLTYIILNVIKRAIHPDFAKVESYAPFQSTDYILTSVWVFLFINGTILQFILARNRLAFPPCPYQKWKRRNAVIGERTPLLHPPEI
ncbi:transmembrane 7 superfamily member 3-like [Pristis pectinata]|uniref:transmembrane 7 superfamily member 3-like n=1 Tax=Pristis pectinata TaxID=685728 RepID=UPI00223D653A|nr:transmembrane 7 superfamily member 3-like [Pristis pectinata]XP_051885110.1 transmembrane 7 superfamily member 3-like [Pristis pectinata]